MDTGLLFTSDVLNYGFKTVFFFASLSASRWSSRQLFSERAIKVRDGHICIMKIGQCK